MNYDTDFPTDQYRRVQRAIPGLEGFYTLYRAVMDVHAPDGGRVLIVGAGGGRELEALAPSPQNLHFTAVDPSEHMLAIARRTASALACEGRVAFVHGETANAPTDPLHDAASALLVMHFLPDYGTKLAFLKEIRKRLRPGAPYVHADVCFDDANQFAAMTKLFRAHAALVGLGLEEDMVARGPEVIGGMPILSQARTLELLTQAGFVEPTLIFRGLWYAMWYARAA